jgi:hypothetical protein
MFNSHIKQFEEGVTNDEHSWYDKCDRRR